MTVVAGLALGHFRQQGLFFQLPLIDLGHRLARAQDHINEQATYEENSYQQRGQNLRQEVLGARTNVTEGPDHQADPENDQKGYNIANEQTC